MLRWLVAFGWTCVVLIPPGSGFGKSDEMSHATFEIQHLGHIRTEVTGYYANAPEVRLVITEWREDGTGRQVMYRGSQWAGYSCEGTYPVEGAE